MKEIKLTQGQIAMIDDEDFHFVSKYKWHASKGLKNRSFYAYRKDNSTGRQIAMHRELLGLNDSKIKVDHKDHNGLNNQMDNIRPCTHQQNTSNQSRHLDSVSKYVGVVRKRKKWQAQIRKNGVCYYLGLYESEIDAVLAYNNAAKKFNKEFANLNTI